MPTKPSSFLRNLLLNLALVASAAIGGLAVASFTPQPLSALSCENDGCSHVCSGGSCTGECFDRPGYNTGCNMTEQDCEVYQC